MTFKNSLGRILFKRIVYVIFIVPIAFLSTAGLIADTLVQNIESSADLKGKVGADIPVLEDSALNKDAIRASSNKPKTRYHGWASSDCKPQHDFTPTSDDKETSALALCRTGGIKSYRKVKIIITSSDTEPEQITYIQEWPCLKCSGGCGCPTCPGASQNLFIGIGIGGSGNIQLNFNSDGSEQDLRFNTLNYWTTPDILNRNEHFPFTPTDSGNEIFGSLTSIFRSVRED